MTWRPGRWTRWFALTAMVLVAAACSEATAERPESASPEVPSRTEGTLTSADGETMGDTSHPGYSVEVPAGWSTLDGHFFVKDGAGVLGMSVWDVAQVPRHPCHWKGTMSEVGPRSTISSMRSRRSGSVIATAPVDATLAGHDGQYLELSVPRDWVVTGDANFEGCDDRGNGHQDFVSWLGRDAGARYEQVAGQVDRVWVLDVEGQTLLVDATYSPGTSATDVMSWIRSSRRSGSPTRSEHHTHPLPRPALSREGERPVRIPALVVPPVVVAERAVESAPNHGNSV